MVCHWGVLLPFIWLVNNGLADGCLCPEATILDQFPSELPTETCCLNYSGSTFGRLPWPVFTNETAVEVLDLSRCNISHIDIIGTGVSVVREVYLSHNGLTTLPGEFLISQTSLRLLDLGMNMLRELPQGFLQSADSLEELRLQGNHLHSLPNSVLQNPALLKLELDGNPWACSCLLMESLQAGHHENRTTNLRDLVRNLTCASPRTLAGRVVWSVSISDVCRPPGLTALFILLPLLILSALILCWCCGRKRKKKKETPAFSTSKKKPSSGSSHCNGQKHRPKPKLPAHGESPAKPDVGREGILQNQLLLRPASTLLGSTRDIYEEVEIKLGSVESLTHASSSARGSTPSEVRRGHHGTETDSRAELDTVSVTEVMKDSSDREKAYMTQSTEYYSLVPAIDLDDSDHAEYESVDLS